MKRMMAAAAVFCLAAGPIAQAGEDSADLKNALAILKKADSATKKVKAVRYHADVSGDGAMADRIPKVSGDVILAGDYEKDGGHWAVEAEITMPGSSETVKLSGGTDGENTYLIDWAEKIAYEDMDPAVLGRRGQSLSTVRMLEYIHPTPFTDEINGREVELLESTKIGDVDCYQVRVAYERVEQQAHWFFGKKDFLPRRVDRIFPGRDGEKGIQRIVLTKVQVSPDFSDEAFKLKLPEGFTKSDDFAP